MKPIWQGVFPAITTQMHKDDSLDLDTNAKFVQYIELAVQECGLDKEWVRAPRQILKGEERKRVLKIIHDGIDRNTEAGRPQTRVAPGATGGTAADLVEPRTGFNFVPSTNAMSTYTQILYHIMFATKHRACVLDKPRRDDLFRYIWGILKNKDCHLYRINGVEDHLHILTSVHPTIALAELVKDIKLATSQWIKTGNVFPAFDAWQEGYGALTCA